MLGFQTMKIVPTVVLILLACSMVISAQEWREGRAKLCFVRYEDNGRMNILESWIHAGVFEVPIIGGQAVCLFVDPGEVEIQISSTIPYDDDSQDKVACKSSPIRLKLHTMEYREFWIEPSQDASTYVCGWQIHQIGTNKKGKRNGARR